MQRPHLQSQFGVRQQRCWLIFRVCGGKLCVGGADSRGRGEGHCECGGQAFGCPPWHMRSTIKNARAAVQFRRTRADDVGKCVARRGNRVFDTIRFDCRVAGEGIPVFFGASSSSSSIANAYSARHEKDSDGVILANCGFEKIQTQIRTWGRIPEREHTSESVKDRLQSCDMPAALSAGSTLKHLRRML
jgi:hypothetical protein